MKKIMLIVLLLLLVGCSDYYGPNTPKCDKGYNFCMGRFMGCMEGVASTDWKKYECNETDCWENPEPHPCYKILEECENMCDP